MYILVKSNLTKATFTSVLQQSQKQSQILQTHGTMQNSMVTSNESTLPFPAVLPLTGQDTQQMNNHNNAQPGLLAGLVSSLAKLMHLKMAPLTKTVLHFSNFNRDFEQIERNKNILPKAKIHH